MTVIGTSMFYFNIWTILIMLLLTVSDCAVINRSVGSEFRELVNNQESNQKIGIPGLPPIDIQELKKIVAILEAIGTQVIPIILDPNNANSS